MDKATYKKTAKADKRKDKLIMNRKKVIVLLAAATMMGSLAGCGNTKETEAPKTEVTTEAATETVAETEVATEDATDVTVEEADTEEATEAETVADPVLEEAKKDYPVTLPDDYSAVSYTKLATVDIETQVEEQINSTLEGTREETQVTDRETKDGDTISLNFDGTIDGEKNDSLSSEGEILTIGSGSFLDEFEEQLIDQKPGEEFDITVTFPDDYWQSDVAGKEAIFKVTINYIVEYGETPELTDEWVQEHVGMETVDEYRTSVTEDVTKQQETSETYTRENEIIESLVAASTVEIPDEDVDPEVETYIQQMEDTAKENGYDSVEDYLGEVYSMTLEQYKENIRDSVVSNAKRSSVVDAVIEKEELSISQEDFMSYLKESVAPSYGYETDKFDLFKSDMTSYGIMEYLDDMYKEHVVAEFLMDKVTVNGADAAETAEAVTEGSSEEETAEAADTEAVETELATEAETVVVDETVSVETEVATETVTEAAE